MGENQLDQKSVTVKIGVFQRNRNHSPFIINNLVAWNRKKVNMEYEQLFSQHLKITPKNGSPGLHASFSIEDFISKGKAFKAVGHSCFLVDTKGALHTVNAVSKQVGYDLIHGLVVILISHVGQESIPISPHIWNKMTGTTSSKKSLMEWIYLLITEHPTLAEAATVIGVIERLSFT